MRKSSDQIFDELLVLRYRAGDRKAIELLIKRWHQKVKRQITRHTYEQEVAEDIAQEVWESVLQSIYKLREPALFGVWTLRIATRKAIDWIRTNQKKRKVIADIKVIEDGVDQKDELLTSLQKGLRELEEQQRHILILFYLEELSIVEISSILEVPTGTVKSRLHHARNHLKQLVLQEYENERT
jgi:RNA polymerase sigma-70 factor (ECF subfamily)